MKTISTRLGRRTADRGRHQTPSVVEGRRALLIFSLTKQCSSHSLDGTEVCRLTSLHHDLSPQLITQLVHLFFSWCCMVWHTGTKCGFRPSNLAFSTEEIPSCDRHVRLLDRVVSGFQRMLAQEMRESEAFTMAAFSAVSSSSGAPSAAAAGPILSLN